MFLIITLKEGYITKTSGDSLLYIALTCSLLQPSLFDNSECQASHMHIKHVFAIVIVGPSMCSNKTFF